MNPPQPGARPGNEETFTQPSRDTSAMPFFRERRKRARREEERVSYRRGDGEQRRRKEKAPLTQHRHGHRAALVQIEHRRERDVRRRVVRGTKSTAAGRSPAERAGLRRQGQPREGRGGRRQQRRRRRAVAEEGRTAFRNAHADVDKQRRRGSGGGGKELEQGSVSDDAARAPWERPRRRSSNRSRDGFDSAAAERPLELRDADYLLVVPVLLLSQPRRGERRRSVTNDNDGVDEVARNRDMPRGKPRGRRRKDRFDLNDDLFTKIRRDRRLKMSFRASFLNERHPRE